MLQRSALASLHRRAFTCSPPSHRRLFGRGHEHVGAKVCPAVPRAHRVEGLQADLPVFHRGGGTAAVFSIALRRARAALRVVLRQAEKSRLRRRLFLLLVCLHLACPCTQGGLPLSEDLAAHLKPPQLLLEVLDGAVHVLQLGPRLAPLLRAPLRIYKAGHLHGDNCNLRGGSRVAFAAHTEAVVSEEEGAVAMAMGQCSLGLSLEPKRRRHDPSQHMHGAMEDCTS
mmetsp:Transcript_66186/g.215393  ORF Transcript_66186/g.215393 Transcript_66186/m.215393 type:complete len:227 (-) Transcript_66186:20-700(-)